MTGKPVRLLAAGDLALSGVLHERQASQVEGLFAGVSERFAATDLSFLSFDCAIGRQGNPPNPQEYVVDCELEHLSALKTLGIDVVSLANNHSTDRGMAALVSGIDVLSRLGVASVGAGADLQAAASPLVIEAQGTQIGFLAFASTHPWVGALAATPTAGGVAALLEDDAEKRVRELASQVDSVVVSLHWGKEYIPLPSPDQTALARRLVDAGAAVVLGHHPHVIQPVEEYAEGVICYSLGNFLFPDDPQQGLRFGDEQRQSLLVEIELTGPTARVAHVEPVTGDSDTGVTPLPAERAQQVVEEAATAAALLGGDEQEARWQDAVRRHEMARLRRVFREEVVAAGWRGGTARLLRLGRKNLLSVGRSLAEIVTAGRKG